MNRLDVVLFVILLVCGSAAADTTLPVPKCVAPLRQREFATQVLLERYKSTVELYRTCLEAFVKEQEAAIEIHRRAAQSAIEDWNKFVGQDMKEPSEAPENKGDDQGFRDKP